MQRGRSISTAILLALAATSVVSASDAAAPRLQLTTHVEPALAKAGDDVHVRFVVANVGTRAFTYETVGDGTCALFVGGFDVHVTGANGSPVEDARSRSGVLSCIGGEGRLAPGATFEVRVSLQHRTGSLAPGEYRVRGSYRPAHRSAIFAAEVQSPDVLLSIAPRTTDEMGVYIEGLAAELRAAGAPRGDSRHDMERARNDLIRKLMYTSDPRVIPAVIDAMYAGRRFPPAARTAFERYLPDRESAKAALLEAASSRGLRDDQVAIILRKLGATEPELSPVIARSLAADSPGTWQGGAAAAMGSADPDPFMARLVAIARDPTTPARQQALIAVAWNRTEEGLKVLREALEDSDARVRETAAKAIRTVYQVRYGPRRPEDRLPPGRPLLPADFDASFQR